MKTQRNFTEMMEKTQSESRLNLCMKNSKESYKFIKKVLGFLQKHKNFLCKLYPEDDYLCRSSNNIQRISVGNTVIMTEVNLHERADFFAFSFYRCRMFYLLPQAYLTAKSHLTENQNSPNPQANDM